MTLTINDLLAVPETKQREEAAKREQTNRQIQEKLFGILEWAINDSELRAAIGLPEHFPLALQTALDDEIFEAGVDQETNWDQKKYDHPWVRVTGKTVVIGNNSTKFQLLAKHTSSGHTLRLHAALPELSESYPHAKVGYRWKLLAENATAFTLDQIAAAVAQTAQELTKARQEVFTNIEIVLNNQVRHLRNTSMTTPTAEIAAEAGKAILFLNSAGLNREKTERWRTEIEEAAQKSAQKATEYQEQQRANALREKQEEQLDAELRARAVTALLRYLDAAKDYDERALAYVIRRAPEIYQPFTVWKVTYVACHPTSPDEEGEYAQESVFTTQDPSTLAPMMARIEAVDLCGNTKTMVIGAFLHAEIEEEFKPGEIHGPMDEAPFHRTLEFGRYNLNYPPGMPAPEHEFPKAPKFAAFMQEQGVAQKSPSYGWRFDPNCWNRREKSMTIEQFAAEFNFRPADSTQLPDEDEIDF